MIILSIETSCDETAVSIIEASGALPHAHYEVRGDALSSQTDIHQAYGGVFPNLAKREHARALVPLLERALAEAKLETAPHEALSEEHEKTVRTILEREPGLADAIRAFYAAHDTPLIDLIAVTNGPGLEPALWVGINFARTLGHLWNVPVMPVDHMEGHIFSSVFDGAHIPDIPFPALALLISGGHTELVHVKEWGSYDIIGNTRDDAVGEAFDKVARMLGLPYPGGPEISKHAEEARKRGITPSMTLPRPMHDSADFDFSFSGLKTAVLYYLKDKTVTPELTLELTLEFENTVTDVLIAKTKKALREYGIRTLILGGGVSANTHLRRSFRDMIDSEYPDVTLYLPDRALTTDNAVMIAIAGHFSAAARAVPSPENIRASGKQVLS